MKRDREKAGPQTFIDEMKAKQDNIVWPGPLVNSRGVDAFLWRGSPNPTWVQRVAAWLFGLTFMSIGAGFLALAWHETESAWVPAVLAVGLWAVGIRTFYNGCRKFKTGPKG